MLPLQNFSDLKTILDHIHDLVLVIDLASNKIGLANQRACDVLEYSPDEIIQLELKDIHPYEMSTVIEFAEKVKTHKGAITNELNYRTKSGRFLPAEVSGKTLVLNGSEYLIAIVRRASEKNVDEKDLISKHEKLEQLVQLRTRELEENNRNLLSEIVEREKAEEQARDFAFFPEENPNPVFKVSEEGKILYANLASCYILEKWETGVGKVLPEIFFKNISRAFEQQKPLEVEHQIADQFYAFVINKVKDKDYANVYAQRITEKKKSRRTFYAPKMTPKKQIKPSLIFSQK
jgi:PAS domain S-box-containing protein